MPDNTKAAIERKIRRLELDLEEARAELAELEDGPGGVPPAAPPSEPTRDPGYADE